MEKERKTATTAVIVPVSHSPVRGCLHAAKGVGANTLILAVTNAKEADVARDASANAAIRWRAARIGTFAVQTQRNRQAVGSSCFA